jgi:hypothetical protein
MSWTRSRFAAGDLVEVRSKEEILATLDRDGRLDGMPFMPEMLRYCGRRVRVDSVAHKTCETARRTWQGRRLETSVHLEDLRCDGSAHGGCEADCKFFWRDEWLKPVESDRETRTRQLPTLSSGCDEARLRDCAQKVQSANAEDVRYACQATELFGATAPLAWWDPRQYVLDVTTGNHSAFEVFRALTLGGLRSWLRHTGRGYRLVMSIRKTIHRWLAGGELPDVQGTIPAAQQTPSLYLDLKPGERVRVKPKTEIVGTLREDNNKNRGLSFDQEMVRYCGTTMTVRRSVRKIIEEGSGKMIEMKQPCIILEGGVCTAEYSACRLMCPRGLPAFWRELWLERVDDPILARDDSDRQTDKATEGADAVAVPRATARQDAL